MYEDWKNGVGVCLYEAWLLYMPATVPLYAFAGVCIVCLLLNGYSIGKSVTELFVCMPAIEQYLALFHCMPIEQSAIICQHSIVSIN